MNTITKFVKAGRDLADAGGAISKLVSAEEDMKARGNRKKNSIWHKFGGQKGNDLEEFMALEKLAQQKKELESYMKLYAPPGTHTRWIEYQGKMRVQRKKEAEEREKQIAQQIKYAAWAVGAVVSAIGAYLLYVFTSFLKGL